MRSIIISGLACVGKTSLAKGLAKKFGINYYGGGEILRKFAKEMGFEHTEDIDFWDSEEGLKFLKERERKLEIDRKVDEELKKLIEKEFCVVTSWTLPWLTNDEFIKIWLKVSENERARRMSLRDKIDIEVAKKIIQERDEKNKELYFKLYGIELGEDLSPFHLVIDTTYLSLADVEAVVEEYVKRWKR
ncbi:MAG: cytidylate kinase family protein [Candidatus Nanoarchaeia archaeon]|nr:cytidylate kinase family protein [Candidatus Haiyanarchaeum thermophilum]MCW1303124.1 cytidylate kinase family protein [Candidatus Haiyanarchaeum thermophilum]MCW1303789.1 cytidylate kinase family protein [Candidatus Haiyanarchaeum thermophilum]MCW1306596.1 cytidylate kinase family protein [Candidatus Haiyanarchaeum thermophilum]MCW1307008.1 cytidylate kinase family protein [Candidatus Haiyanarchaeum thermophilum]